jgi:hypothetical protein
MQPVAALVRYMTHANRRDFLDCHWLLVAEEKTPELATLLISHEKKTNELVMELTKKKEAIEREAVIAGVNLESARKEFYDMVVKKKKKRGEMDTEELQVCALTVRVSLLASSAVFLFATALFISYVMVC